MIRLQQQTNSHQQSRKNIIHSHQDKNHTNTLPKIINTASHFASYEKGEKMIEPTHNILFRINHKEIHKYSQRYPTEPVEHKINKPVSPFFQNYIAKSLEKRKITPLKYSLDHSHLIASQRYAQSPKQLPVLNRISLEPTDIVVNKISRHPLRNNLKERYHKLKLKQKLEQTRYELQLQKQTPSLKQPPDLFFNNEGETLKIEPKEIPRNKKHKKQQKEQKNVKIYHIPTHPPEEVEDRREKLTPWHLDEEEEHLRH